MPKQLEARVVEKVLDVPPCSSEEVVHAEHFGPVSEKAVA
jgi:hypothetical protein